MTCGAAFTAALRAASRARGSAASRLAASTTTIRRIDGRLGPDFPAALRAFDGRTVKLQGYILPLQAGQAQRHFLLSAWSPSCPFCQTAGPEAMVEVKMRAPVKYSVEPVVVEGRLALLDNDAGGLFYRLAEAVPSALP